MARVHRRVLSNREVQGDYDNYLSGRNLSVRKPCADDGASGRGRLTCSPGLVRARLVAMPRLARYLPGPGRGVGRGDDPPRPSSMPIDVEGVLIWSGGRGLGAIALVYRQGSQPRERLHDHEYAQCARQPRHAPHNQLMSKVIEENAPRDRMTWVTVTP
jgi:hypothetical protein